MNGTPLTLISATLKVMGSQYEHVSDPQHLDLLDPNFDPHGLYTKRAINTLSSFADVQPTSSMAISPPKSPLQASKHHNQVRNT